MELVPPNSKKWLSTLVPPKATRRAKNNQSQRIFTLSEWCSAALFKHYYTIFLVFIQLQNMWIRSFRAFSPQKLHHLQRRRLEPFLSSSSWLLSPCPAFGCWSRQPHVRHDGKLRERIGWLPLSIFRSDLRQISSKQFLLHQKCALGRSPFPNHPD